MAGPGSRGPRRFRGLRDVLNRSPEDEADAVTTPLMPVSLRCAHQVNPLAVSPDRVRLSWQVQGEGSRRLQRAYQIRVRREDAPARDGNLVWDSGRLESSSSTGIGYAGSPLARGRRYAWQVRVWDENLVRSDWSEQAWFEVELDPAAGWRGSWIGLGAIREDVSPPTGMPDPVLKALASVPYLRRAFRLEQPVRSVASARLYITALGLYEARLNGARVGDAVLAPGWTDYTRRVPYQAYDVTELLRDGENAIGALLADGWYAGFV